MANLKNPVLSLSARGSLGETLTFTRRRSQNIVEKKPELPYFLTLPVQYQRWLYEDYVAQWNNLTPAQKQAYASPGTRHHLTAFQYFMKYQLTNLPDLAGYWKLDDNNSPTVLDSSRNNNIGTVIGASPAVGPISGALSFDGINDYVDFGNSPTLRPTTTLTMELFANFHLLDGTWDSLFAFIGEIYEIMLVVNVLWVRIILNTGFLQINTGLTPVLGTWYHLAAVWDSTLGANQLKFYLNGAFHSQATLAGQIAYGPITRCWLGTIPLAANYCRFEADEVKLHGRALTSSDVLRHSLRRWP